MKWYPIVKVWMVTLLFGLLLASLLAWFSRGGTRLIRIRTSVSTESHGYCDDMDCHYCMQRRPCKTWRAFFLLIKKPAYWRYTSFHRLLAILGFLNGLLWIYILSSEVITLLKALGKILNLSDSILGITVFTFGNCIGDFATNIMIARMGYFAMAAGASWGAPMTSTSSAAYIFIFKIMSVYSIEKIRILTM